MPSAYTELHDFSLNSEALDWGFKRTAGLLLGSEAFTEQRKLLTE